MEICKTVSTYATPKQGGATTENVMMNNVTLCLGISTHSQAYHKYKHETEIHLQTELESSGTTANLHALGQIVTGLGDAPGRVPHP